MSFVSIIIPCRNEEKYIEKCLSSIYNNNFPIKNYEVIIVDGLSKDRTNEIANGFQIKYNNLKLISNPQKITPVAMNLGIKAAKGDIIMRMDMHAYYPPEYISTLLLWKEKLQVDGIGAIWHTDVLTINKCTVAIKKVLSHKFGVGNSLFRTGIDKPLEVDTVPFGCYDKKIFERIGYFDERLVRNQDIEFNNRLKQNGMKIFLIHYTYSVYYARERFIEIAKNNYGNGFWNILTVYYTKNFQSLSIRHFIPLMFIFSLIIPSLLGLIDPLFFLLLAFSLLMYLLALSKVIISMDKKETNIFYLFAAFTILHVSYGLGSLIALFHIKKLHSK